MRSVGLDYLVEAKKRRKKTLVKAVEVPVGELVVKADPEDTSQPIDEFKNK